MSTTTKFSAFEKAAIALVPTADDHGAVPLAGGVSFGPFAPGDSLTIASTASFHLVAGTSGVAVSTSSPRFLAGVFKMVLPDGCTHVAMIDSVDGAGVGQAYKG